MSSDFSPPRSTANLTVPPISPASAAVVLVNVLGFFEPLRGLIKGAVASGFINGRNEDLIVFVDCPPDADPATYNWGTAALAALNDWCSPGPGFFAWKPYATDRDSLSLS